MQLLNKSIHFTSSGIGNSGHVCYLHTWLSKAPSRTPCPSCLQACLCPGEEESVVWYRVKSGIKNVGWLWILRSGSFKILFMFRIDFINSHPCRTTTQCAQVNFIIKNIIVVNLYDWLTNTIWIHLDLGDLNMEAVVKNYFAILSFLLQGPRISRCWLA